MVLQAGAARLDITPRTPQKLTGYPPQDRFHAAVHQPLHARALHLRGQDGDALLVALDLLFVEEGLLQRVRATLQAELGLAPERVFVTASHTHAAPGVKGVEADEEYLGMVERQIVAAAALARTRLRPVALSFARHACNIGINRREKLPSGQVILGNNPAGFNDRELLVLALNAANGARIASVFNFACHGTVLGDFNKVLSGDWPGGAALTIEKQEPGTVALFVNGGAANINPRERGDYATPELADRVAAEFCAAYAEACKKLAPLPEDAAVAGRSLTLQLPRKAVAVEGGQGRSALQLVHGLRIGPVRLVGFPGEVFSETSAAVKQASPHAQTLVASYACGMTGGYVPVAEAYDDGGYEVAVSPYGAQSEAVLRAGFLKLLREL
ncbi:MAG: neutral/alkaline non-lysosomal ceramidase N-terminal domain-containing protein [Planctomycetes bacterium]|nr:neutral/alkaline non-lysosomal ceramidase N-terminal domain-containing protein [Planctomycetota bacterium]